MREVVDGVIEIPIGYVKAYAVVVDDGVVLVTMGHSLGAQRRLIDHQIETTVRPRL